MSAHFYLVNDPDGSLFDVVVLCSDSCHRFYCQDNGLTYEGWNGCHDIDTPTPCAVCATTVEGIE
jgi:hypothetical protein